MSSEDHTVSFTLEVNTSRAVRALLKVQTVLYGVLGLLHRLGLPEPIDAAIRKLQQLIAAANMLRRSLILLETASGPLGWTMATVAVVGTALSFGEMLEGY